MRKLCEEQAMVKRTFDDELAEREAATRNYAGKLLMKKDDIHWHTLTHGRYGMIVDQSTGMEARAVAVLIMELAPGYQSALHKHTYEAIGYVLEGRGYEIIGDQRVDWEVGDTFYMPANVPHRHVNKDPVKPARFLQIETWPLMISLGIGELVEIEAAGKTT